MNTESEEKYSLSRRKFIGNAAALSTFFIVPRFVLGGKGYTPPSDMITLGFIGAGRRAIELQKSLPIYRMQELLQHAMFIKTSWTVL